MNPYALLNELRENRDELKSLLPHTRDENTSLDLECQIAELEDRIYFWEYKLEDSASDVEAYH